MWTCVRCQRSIEPSLDTRWAYGTTRDGVVDPTFELAEAAWVGPDGRGVAARVVVRWFDRWFRISRPRPDTP